eukprot:12938088-Prorocentrum_lima.AAC.1
MTLGQKLHEWQTSPSGNYATKVIKTNHAVRGEACVYARSNSINRLPLGNGVPYTPQDPSPMPQTSAVGSTRE